MDSLSVKAIGFEFDQPFDKNKFEYNLEIDTQKVQFKCNKIDSVTGCNETVSLVNKTNLDHIIEYTSQKGKKYSYTFHITKKDTNGPIKIDSIEFEKTDYSNKSTTVVVKANSDKNKKLKYSFDDWGYEVLNLVNEERAKYNVAPLKWDDSLAALAESHCEDMIDRNFFAHNTPDGQTPFDRMKAAGKTYSSAGENIAAGQSSPQNVMDSWMNSPGHRKNILNPDFEYIGVGLARGGSYGIYWAQEFATFK